MTKTAFLSVLACGIWLIVIFESSVMMVGLDETLYYTDPTIVSYRLVEVDFIEFLTRVDILYLTGKLAGFIVFICIAYCAVIEFLMSLLPRTGRGTLTIIIGVILLIFGILASKIDNMRYYYNNYAIYAAPICVIAVPLMLLAVAKIKKLGKR